MNQNKTGKYLKYAIGEIILVVIGILIALQINDWNTELKNKKLEKIYIGLIKEDLIKDTISLRTEINRMYQDSMQLVNISRRLSLTSATLDTLVKIARFEYNPWYEPSQTFNTNTYESLINTGKIEILSTELIYKLKTLKEMQDAYGSSLFVSQLYLDASYNYAKKYSFKNAFNLLGGQLEVRNWNSVNKDELFRDFNYLIGAKNIANMNFLARRRTILNETKELINYIERKLIYD